MIDRRFLRIFVTGFVVWAGIFTAFIAFVDPYGLWKTPKIERINAYKPARANLDRQIKPLEVLRDQPRTIFLGTSRAQEGLDPSVLDGTKYAPIYNASIPAETIVENEALLNQYFDIAPSIKHVVMEVFFYQMVMAQPPAKSRSIWDLTDNLLPLFFSVGALEKSIITLRMNYQGRRDLPSIDAGGYWVPPEPYKPAMPFFPYSYSDGIAEIHLKIPDMQIQDSNMQALIRMREACKRHGATFTILFAPNHPWDDYRLLALGYWSRMETMYRRLSDFEEVYSASQYNNFTTEPTTDQLPKGGRMKYWYDPIHFSPVLGREILKAWAGIKSEHPENLLIKITPENVEQYLKERMRELKNWTQQNREFVNAFEQARRFHCTDEESCKNLGMPDKLNPTAGQRGKLTGDILNVDGIDYSLRGGIGGSVEIAKSFDHILIVRGWAMDDRKDARPAYPATGIAVVVNDNVIDVVSAQYRRLDIEEGFGIDTRPTGFRTALRIPSPVKNGQLPFLRLFALTKDRYAVPISNSTTAPDVEFIQVPFPAVLH